MRLTYTYMRCTLQSATIPQMNRQNDAAPRTVRIRVGGLPKGSAVLKLKDEAAAVEVRDLLQGAVLGDGVARTAVNRKFPTDIYINGLTENEDEVTLFSEFERIGIVPKLKPDYCIQIQTTWRQTEEQVRTWFAKVLRPYGPIAQIELREAKYCANAVVVFQTERQAIAARDALNRKTDLFPEFGSTLVSEAKIQEPTFISLPLEVSKRFKAEIQKELDEFNRADNTHPHYLEAKYTERGITLSPPAGTKKGQLFYLSSPIQSINGLMETLSSYINGKTLALSSDSDTSHSAFSLGAGKVIQQLQKTYKVVIQYQLLSNSCVIYGPEENVDKAYAELEKFVRSIENFVVEAVPLSVSHFTVLLRAVAQDLTKLREPGDTSSFASYNRDKQIISVHGDKRNVENIVKKIEKVRTMSVGGDLEAPSSQFGVAGCAICKSATNLMVLIICGHTMCVQCLKDHLLSAIKFPIACPGGSVRKCEHVVGILDAKKVLDGSELEEIVQRSTDYMLANHRKLGVGRRYKHCPTPRCAQLYLADANKFHCDICGEKYCLRCARARGVDPLVVKDHSGESCEEHLANNISELDVASSTAPDIRYNYLNVNNNTPNYNNINSNSNNNNNNNDNDNNNNDDDDIASLPTIPLSSYKGDTLDPLVQKLSTLNIVQKQSTLNLQPLSSISLLSLFSRFQQKTDTPILKRNLRIIQQIGSGGMKTATLCEHLPDRRFVVLLSVKNNNDNSLKQSMKHERDILQNLNHPQIVSYVGFHEDGVSFVTLYCPKGDVFGFLSQTKNISSEDRKQIAIQVAKALEYLHSLSDPLVHFDIKSANVLLDENSNCKLTDFGLAQRQSTIQAQRRNIGFTPNWAAPEQLDLNFSIPSTKSDVYAFGGFLIELVLHTHPWRGHNNMQIKNEVLNGKMPPEWQRVKHKEIRPLIQQCMRLEPSARPTMAQVLSTLNTLK